MWSPRVRAWQVDSRDGHDLEQRVADWLTQQEAADWLPSAMILGTLLTAMVLFAVSRLA
jgi:hypothetical protein